MRIKIICEISLMWTKVIATIGIKSSRDENQKPVSATPTIGELLDTRVKTVRPNMVEIDKGFINLLD